MLARIAHGHLKMHALVNRESLRLLIGTEQVLELPLVSTTGMVRELLIVRLIGQYELGMSRKTSHLQESCYSRMPLVLTYA